MKILLSAYFCDPNRGSERAVGWNYALQAARFNEVWVLTWDVNRSAIEEHLKNNPIRNLRFIYAPAPKIFDQIGNLKYVGAQLRYYAWQATSYKTALLIHNKIKFDLAHHVTFVTWRVPSFLWKLGIPFIWGPVGGGQNIPASLIDNLSISSVKEHIRTIHQYLAKRDPFVRRTARKAALSLAVNNDTAEVLEKIGCKEIRKIPASNIEGISVPLPAKKDKNKVGIIVVSVLEPWKAVDIAIESFNRCFQKNNAVLEIYGSGSKAQQLIKLARALGIGDKVVFHGNIDRSVLLRSYRNADLMLFTGLRDSAGLAILESMEAELPVVCINNGGPGEIINERCGILIKPQNREQIINDLAGALDLLISSPETRKTMGKEGRKRVLEHYTWDKIGIVLRDLYKEVAEKNAQPRAREKYMRL